MAALSAGTRLGTYEVVEPIGAGGMGEVYRARDTNLGRDVAIKVLPEDFSADEERLARFRREAQVLASLNHPNIAAIYGTEGNALILELVEGPTLAERIAQGAIPLDEAIAIARQIAAALEAAHEAGVIHRDLKPANIKAQDDGTVKVLDFGLAKAIEGEAEGDSSESPTSLRQGSGLASVTAAATRAGVIMGTAAYMSPEQARGKRVDRRADIWAFGAVVYEMLTARRAFEAEDISLTLAEVMKSEPDWEALPTEVSPTLRTYLIRCFEKDPKRRVRDMGDLRLAMEGAFETGAASTSTAAKTRGRWPAIGMALVLSVITGVVGFSLRPKAPRPLVRSVVSSPSAPPSLRRTDVDVAITPDGTQVVYAGSGQLFVRALDDLEPTSVGNDRDIPGGVFVSPDGNWVGYFAEDMKKVSLLGGPAVSICKECRDLNRGASWGEDDTIIFTSSDRGLWRVGTGGGEPVQLTVPEPRQAHRWPEILPGGDAVLFTIHFGSAFDQTQIAVLSLDSGETKVLVPGGSYPRYVPTGHIVYGAGGTLRAVSFDMDRLEVTGDPVPVLEGVITKDSGAANFAISHNGSLAYVAGPRDELVHRTLVWVDRDGRVEELTAPPRRYRYPRISPDGTRVALDVRDQDDDIWIWDFARERLTRLTFDTSPDRFPVWTRDGARVTFGSDRDGLANLYTKAADGTGAVELLAESANILQPYSYSPDDMTLVIRNTQNETGLDIGVLSMGADGTIENLLATEFLESNAELSPDGRWIAYEGNASGQKEVYVRPFPDVDGGRWQISTEGGQEPLWRPDGRELFYRSSSGQLIAVEIQADSDFTYSNPDVVLDGRSFFVGFAALGRTYDVSPDGNRFLMIKEKESNEDDETAQVILIQNWTDELKRLVPVDN